MTAIAPPEKCLGSAAIPLAKSSRASRAVREIAVQAGTRRKADIGGLIAFEAAIHRGDIYVTQSHASNGMH